MVDWDKVKSEAERQRQQHQDKVTSRIVALGNGIERRLDQNPNDPAVELVEVLLGIAPGGKAKATELLADLGFEPSASEEGPRALPSNGSREGYGDDVVFKDGQAILPVYEADSSRTGVAQRENDGIAAGLVYKMVDGKIVGLQPKPQHAAPEPSPAQAQDQEVPILNRKGEETGRKVKISEGRKNPKLEAVLAEDNSVEKFIEKPFFTVGRRK